MKPFLQKEGEKYQEFLLVRYEPISELNSILRELIHLPTGALIMHLENDDPENLFCLSFKTLPNSSSGTPHILEHTVLCGSKKFPVKDPFFSMNRRSLNTFMNALTGSDFTCYPAATQVEKDFYNLLEVYLDAAFHPRLNELSFLQEGHRLEFTDPKDPTTPLVYKGIVYNEMKGAMSSPDSRIWQAMMETLVPDLPYAFNSGGAPEKIPELTYQQLIEFHETYYHPSHCLFFFYGNFSLQKHLDFIQTHTLVSATKLPPLDGIHHQRRFDKPIHQVFPYPVSLEEKKLDKKHMYALGWLTSPLLNQEDVLALSVLDLILMDTDASPLKKALLKTKICTQVDSFLDNEMSEVPIVFLFRGCKENQGQVIEETVRENLKKIAKKGIAYSLVETALHQFEFSRMEITGDHAPFGLTLFMRSALAKQHGCDPSHSLTLHSLFNQIRENAKDPHFFTAYIEKYFLNNSHFALLSCPPDPHLLTKEAENEQKVLQTKQEALTDQEKLKIIEQTEKLSVYQEQSEEEHLNCLPKVTLEDVPKETKFYPLKETKRSQVEIYHHDAFTNHILYADFVYDLPYLTKEELRDLQLFITLWHEVGAKNRSYEENLDQIHALTGGVGAHVSLHVQTENPKEVKPSLQFHGKALRRNARPFFELFKEMITAPRYDEKQRIKELILQLGTALENRLARNAMRYATHLSLASLSLPNGINELWYGLSYYQYIQHLVQNIDREITPLMQRLEALREKILGVGTPNLIVCCDQDLFHFLDKANFYGFMDLPTKPFEPWKNVFPLSEGQNQARVIPSPVAFTTHGFSTVSYTHPDAPALQISTYLMENKVLHHRIREQGGAYGAGASYNPLWGNFYLYGYRDPHIAHTVRCFSDAISEIAAGNFSASDLEEAKLGIIQDLDTPISPGSRAMAAYVYKRDGKTRQFQQNFRDKLLLASSEEVSKAVATHLVHPFHQGFTTTFAERKLLEKEIPLMEPKKLEILPIHK